MANPLIVLALTLPVAFQRCTQLPCALSDRVGISIEVDYETGFRMFAPLRLYFDGVPAENPLFGIALSRRRDLLANTAIIEVQCTLDKTPQQICRAFILGKDYDLSETIAHRCKIPTAPPLWLAQPRAIVSAGVNSVPGIDEYLRMRTGPKPSRSATSPCSLAH